MPITDLRSNDIPNNLNELQVQILSFYKLYLQILEHAGPYSNLITSMLHICDYYLNMDV